MDTSDVASTESESRHPWDRLETWIGALGGAAIIIGALLHWAGPVAGTQTNLRALWDPALVRDASLIRTVGFVMILLGVVAVAGALSRSRRVTSLAGILVILGVGLFAISIMRGSGNLLDMNIGPLACLVGGLAAAAARRLADRLSRTT